jgi:hypothetical protein
VVECYAAVCRVVSDAGGELSHEAIIEGSSEVLDNAYRLGLSGHPEAANRSTFGNALELLLERQILSRTDPSVAIGKANFAPGEEWLTLAELQELLARLATAG